MRATGESSAARTIAQNLLNVQHLHQARPVCIAIQLGNAGDQLATVAVGGQHIAPVQPHDLVHLFHGKGLRGARVFGHHQDGQAPFGNAADHGRQVDDGNDLATDIGHAQHVGRRVGDGGDGRHDHDLAHLEHIDAEQFATVTARGFAQAEQHQFEFVVAREVAALIGVVKRGGHGCPAPVSGFSKHRGPCPGPICTVAPQTHPSSGQLAHLPTSASTACCTAL